MMLNNLGLLTLCLQMLPETEVALWHKFDQPSTLLFPIANSDQIGYNYNKGGYVLLGKDQKPVNSGRPREKGYVVSMVDSEVYEEVAWKHTRVEVLRDQVFLVRQGFSHFVLNGGITFIGPRYCIGVNSLYPAGAFGAKRDGSVVVFVTGNGSGVSMLRKAALADRGYYFTNDPLPLSADDNMYCLPMDQYSSIAILDDQYGAFIGGFATFPERPLSFSKKTLRLPMIDVTEDNFFPKTTGILFVTRFKDGYCQPVAQVRAYQGHMTRNYNNLLVDDLGRWLHIYSSKGIFRLSTKSLIEAYVDRTGVKPG